MARTRSNPTELTPEERRLFRFIFEYLERHGFQPTKSEIAGHMNITKNAVSERLAFLTRRGFLQPSGGEPRALRINFLRCRVFLDDSP